MTTPLVSIIIPAYNHEAYVGSTLESIAEQTYQNIQLVIIDDGSIDLTAQVIESFFAKHATRFTDYTFISRPNKGLSSTLNECLGHADGKYVYIIASDDLVTKVAIHTLVETMEANPEAGMACGDASFIDKRSQPLTRKAGGYKYNTFVRYMTRNRRYYTIPFELHVDFGSYESLLGGNYIPIGPLIRKSVYAEIGSYDTSLIYEDYDYWIRMAHHYPMKFVASILAHYRAHDTNLNRVLRNHIYADRIKIHIREKEYSINNGYGKAWSLKFIELTLGLIARGQWRDAKNLISHGELRLIFMGSTLFLLMITRRALQYASLHRWARKR